MSVIALTVALLGAESTGKSELAHALCHTLLSRHGLHGVCVPEHLRAWCQQHGRAPQQHEQAGIAAAQTQAIAHACNTPGVQVVLADTTALMVAVYSEQYFSDTTLWPQALADHAACDLTLLMGLDLPWVADGLFRDSPAARQTTDAILRSRLVSAGVAHQTVYGRGEARLNQALRALGAVMGQRLVVDDPDWEQGRRRWSCEKCSDPECEHRLFQDLLAHRAPPGG